MKLVGNVNMLRFLVKYYGNANVKDLCEMLSEQRSNRR
jgi:hypothetical protein